MTRTLPGKYVETRQFADGRLEVRWNGVCLPFQVFGKDQRVSHTAIIENKRLGEVLAWIKEQQDAGLPPPKVKTESEKRRLQAARAEAWAQEPVRRSGLYCQAAQ